MRLPIVFLLMAMAAPRLATAASDQRAMNAKQACAGGRPQEGVELLAQLFAESGDYTFVYNQGRCYQQNGISDKAINRFREYLRRAPNLSAQDRREVEEFIAELEKTEQPPPKPSGQPVQPMLAPPTVPPPLVAESQAPISPPPDGVQPSPKGSRLRKLGIGLAALGAVAVGTGVVLTFKMKSLESDIERDAAAPIPPDAKDLKSRIEQGGRLEAFQWIGYGLGAAAIAAGATCYLLGSREATERSITLGWTPAPEGRGFFAWLGGRY